MGFPVFRVFSAFSVVFPYESSKQNVFKHLQALVGGVCDDSFVMLVFLRRKSSTKAA